MALVLKTGKTYSDIFGNTYSDAYGVVDQCNGNKKDRIQHITFEIYKDQSARQNKKHPVAFFSYTITEEEFDTYFSSAAIAADKDQYNRSYAWLLALEIKDEYGNSMNPVQYVWSDWESDEV